MDYKQKLELKAAYDSIPVITEEELLAMEPAEQMQLLGLVEESIQFKKNNRFLYLKPDPWVNKVNNKMNDHMVCSILASNRSGKSYSSTWMLAQHLTGQYSPEWDGFKFDSGIDAWILCPSAENYVQANGLQDYLLGNITEPGTGWIPSDAIIKLDRGTGTKGFIKKMYIQHISGTVSTLEFKSYEQGAHVLQGASIDLAVIDEEPKNSGIFPEVLTRVLQARSGKGRVLLSFTPTLGLTTLVKECFEGIYQKGNERITVWDCPWIPQSKIDEWLKTMPKEEQDLRLRGIPKLMAGAVFQVPESISHGCEIDCWDDIPDHWDVMNAIDIGANDPTCIIAACRNPETDDIYIYDEYYERYSTIEQDAEWIKEKFPFAPLQYPPDSDQTRKGMPENVSMQYRGKGINLTAESFRNPHKPNGKQDNYILPGVFRMRELMEEHEKSKLHIHPRCHNLLRELRIYAYGKDGKIAGGQSDHAIDACRYAIQSFWKAQSKYDTIRSSILWDSEYSDSTGINW